MRDEATQLSRSAVETLRHAAVVRVSLILILPLALTISLTLASPSVPISLVLF